MEWMLQVVDEIDDVISSARLFWVGIRRAVALILAGVSAAALLTAMLVLGATSLMMMAGAVLCSALVAVALRQRFARDPLSRS